MWTEILSQLDLDKLKQRCVELWSIEPTSFRHVISGINIIAKAKLDQQFVYIRVTHQQLISKTQLLENLKLLYFLNNNHQLVPKPLRSIKNSFVENLEVGNEVYLISVVTKCPGQMVNHKSLNSEQLYKWGEQLALFHLTASKYQSTSSFKTHITLLNEFDNYASKVDSDICRIYTETKSQIIKLDQTSNNYGLTHADHRSANILFYKTNFYFIDFDEPLYNWYVSDIVRPFLEDYINNSKKIPDNFFKLITGYKSINQNIDLSLEIIELFLRFKALDIYLWTTAKWDSDQIPGGGNTKDWMQNIKQALL